MIKKNLISTLLALSVAVVGGLILYEFQMMFEANKKQVEYLEKINIDIKKYFVKKQNLLDKQTSISINIFQSYRQGVFNIINKYKDKDLILEKYINEINSIELNMNINIQKVLEENMKQIIEIGFLEENIRRDLIFLKIYSNDSLDNYEKELFNSLKLVDTLYAQINNNINTSIYQMTNYTFIMDNIRTVKDLRVILNNLPFPKNSIPELKKSQADSRKVYVKVSELTNKILEDINNKMNGNIFERMEYIFKDKITLLKVID
jgi:hypothetical protein